VLLALTVWTKYISQSDSFHPTLQAEQGTASRPSRAGRFNRHMRSVRDIGDELYALPPGAFTAARDRFIADARENGDRAAATQLAAMKRPTQAAWLVDLLALRRPDVVNDLIGLGEQIRTAQGSVPPAQLRDLSARRRRELDTALGLCSSLAAEAGEGEPTRQQLGEAEATLAAAMADDDAAALVRSGRVVKPLVYTGFGDGFGATVPTRAGSTPPAARPSPARETRIAERPTTDDTVRDRERAERKAAAEANLITAEQALDAARATERAANDEIERLTGEIARLRGLLETAQFDARAARQARIATERQHESAERRLRREG
jgi:hypothetical protein